MQEMTQRIKQKAHKIGFHKVGITCAQQPENSALLTHWLSKGYHGTMNWMIKYKNIRQNIYRLMPDAKSVICVAHNYYTPFKHSNNKDIAKISRYAWGKDYHVIMKKKLKKLLYEIQNIIPDCAGRVCVDSAPIMEKLWAAQAGIGWQGKNTNIITRDYGSWIFLGEIIINRELEYDTPIEDFCGNCRSCLDACPTGALIGPYQLDASRCISYVTIELGNELIPEDLAKKMQNWVFGCDICQDVCPWNRFQKVTSETAYLPAQGNITPKMKDLRKIDEKEFKMRFRESPIYRTGWKNFVRNVKTVMKVNVKQ
jgi:epoxyqueuosine reductase